jgi:hypothetical protein
MAADKKTGEADILSHIVREHRGQDQPREISNIRLLFAYVSIHPRPAVVKEVRSESWASTAT